MASAIDLYYNLELDEIYKAYLASGLYKQTGKKAIIEDIILAVFGVYFTFSYINNTKQYFNLIMAVICFVVAIVLVILPRIVLKKQCREFADGRTIKMHILPHKLAMDDGAQHWDIKLDKTSQSKTVNNELILIITPEKQLVILPVRAIPKNMLEGIQDIIFDGTKD